MYSAKRQYYFNTGKLFTEIRRVCFSSSNFTTLNFSNSLNMSSSDSDPPLDHIKPQEVIREYFEIIMEPDTQHSDAFCKVQVQNGLDPAKTRRCNAKLWMNKG